MGRKPKTPKTPDDPIAVLATLLPLAVRPSLTTTDLIAEFGWTRRQIERWSQSGRLACVHVGNARRYTPEGVAAFVRENTLGGAA